mgnify:CR=1 FL=1
MSFALRRMLLPFMPVHLAYRIIRFCRSDLRDRIISSEILILTECEPILTKDIPNVEVKAFEGLSVNFARENHAQVIVRGLRAVTDFEYELQMAQTNRVLAPDVDTVFLTTSLEYAYLSSTIMKEVANFGGDLSKFAPREITDAVEEKLKKRETEK